MEKYFVYLRCCAKLSSMYFSIEVYPVRTRQNDLRICKKVWPLPVIVNWIITQDTAGSLDWKGLRLFWHYWQLIFRFLPMNISELMCNLENCVTQRFVRNLCGVAMQRCLSTALWLILHCAGNWFGRTYCRTERTI